MKSSFAMMLASILLAFATGQAHGQASPSSLSYVDLPDTLARVLRDYEESWAAGDAEALAALFTEDGFVLSGDSPPIRGHEAIAERYQSAGGELYLRALAFETAGSVGYIIGTYTYDRNIDQGKFVLTLRDVEGHWLITSDQDNPISN